MADPLTPAWDGHRPSERELLAFITRVLDEHEAPLLRTAFGLTGDWPAAQDAVHDAFLALCDTLMAGQRIGHVAPWLRSTVRHKAIDWVRARAREREALAGLARHPPDSPRDPAQAAERADTLHHVLARLDDLSERERRVIELRFLQGKSSTEAAQALGTNPQTVRNQFQRALSRLRELLAKDRRE